MFKTEIECDRCHETKTVNGQPSETMLEQQFSYKKIADRLLCPQCVKALMDFLGVRPVKRDGGFSDGREVPSKG